MKGIKEIVRGLQCKYNTCDPRIIIEGLEFEIVDKPWENIFGTMVRCGNKVTISASTLLPEPMRRYAYGHELGHAVLHKGLDVYFMDEYTCMSKDKVERQADTFCAYLLLPDESMKGYCDCSLEYIAADLDVPFKLLEFRLSLK